MWRLTIYQKQKNSYLNDGKEVTYDTENRVEFESQSVGYLFEIVAAIAKVYEPNLTRYEIVKVVD